MHRAPHLHAVGQVLTVEHPIFELHNRVKRTKASDVSTLRTMADGSGTTQMRNCGLEVVTNLSNVALKGPSSLKNTSISWELMVPSESLPATPARPTVRKRSTCPRFMTFKPKPRKVKSILDGIISRIDLSAEFAYANTGIGILA